MELTPVILSRLEKAAVDNGFDRELSRDTTWLTFASTQCPLRIWLSAMNESRFVVAFSQLNVARALTDYEDAVVATAFPSGAVGGRIAGTIPVLHGLLRRSFQLSRSLPDELLHAFERQTVALPKTTEAERLLVQRVGQGIFRNGLMEYWEGRCAITGLSVPELLRASHIKPWAQCATDAERLDVYNGILLAAHLDAAFDCGLITITDDGDLLVSSGISAENRKLLGLNANLRLSHLTDEHRRFLPWHRDKVFLGR